MQICCQSPPPQAEARKIGFWGSFVENDLKPLPEIEFGPVVNDPKCGRQVIKSAVNLEDTVNSLTAAYYSISDDSTEESGRRLQRRFWQISLASLDSDW